MKNYLIIIVICLHCMRANAAKVAFTLGGDNDQAISLTIPDDWRASKAGAYTFSIVNSGAPKFSFLITAFPLPKAAAESSSAKDLAQDAADRIEPMAENAPLIVKTFSGPNMQGAYFCSTDPSPKPGEFKYMQQIMVISERRLVSATLLTNESKDAFEAKSLDVIKSIRFFSE